MSILINILLVIFALVALLMILVILMQRPKSEGLGAAFGGGVTDNIFGAQTTNVLTKFTSWLAGIFFTLTFILSMLYAHQSNMRSGLRNELMKTEPAAAVPAAALSPSPAAAGPAVGAPGTVTNPAPAPAAPGAAPAEPLTPADQAVGVTAPAPAPTAPVEATAAPIAPAPTP
ncbi:MAG TPA: preprotein translocase subunit SecG [Chthoniobacterales bacterium]|nr:preprotein translocase subunit SecG [Chthoniobacterales bacterium]